MSHIAIITGGAGSERAVSLRSAAAVAESLKQGWYSIKSYDFPVELDCFLDDERPDFAFVMIHGKDGEDGKIPAFLEVLGIPHQGTDFRSHAISIDKIQTKDVWRRAWIPVAKDIVVSSYDKTQEEFREIVRREIGFPLVIKNPTEWSTIGVYIVQDESELNKHWSEIVAIKTPLLVEQFISGKEITIALLDMPDGETRILPVVEIIPPEWATFDYENKYNGKTSEICPARIPEPAAERIKQIALRAYKALGIKGYGRIDAIIDPTGIPYLLEINTIPGFTSASLFPLAAKTAGISFLDLLELLMDSGKQSKYI